MLSRIRAHLPPVRRALRRRRRTLTVLLIALLAAMLLPHLLPPSIRGHTVLVAAEDLPGGQPLAAEHLREVEVAASLLPAGTTSTHEELLGRETTVPVPQGTPILPGLLDGGDDSVVPAGSALMAVPAPGVLAPHLLPGTQVEILASGPDPGAPQRIPAQVVDLPGSAAEPAAAGIGGTGSGGDVVVLVTVDRPRAGDLADAMGEGWLTLSVVG